MVNGSFSTRVGRDGRFEEKTERRVTHADAGSETEVAVRGRLTESGAQGTIDAHARAYDNAGTTFECSKRGIEWQAAAETDPAARRVDGFFPTDAEAVSVTSDAVFVDKDRGDKASIVRRLDPRTGKTRWSRRLGDTDRLAAGGPSLPVWCVSIRSRARWSPKPRSTIPPTSSRSPPARMRWSSGVSTTPLSASTR